MRLRINKNVALDRILSYLLATSSFKIKGIFGSKKNELLTYTDSDHAGNMPMTTFSHTGVILMLNNVPIKWKSTKQTKTSRCSAEAETYALDCGVGEAQHINNKDYVPIKFGVTLNYSRVKGRILVGGKRKFITCKYQHRTTSDR